MAKHYPGADIDHLEFEDNRLAAELAGGADGNLLILEGALNVRIDPRGNRMAVSGDKAARAAAACALLSLYDRLQRGHPVGPEDARAAARMTAGAPTMAGAEGLGTAPGKDAADAFGSVAIKTQKRLIAPRSINQAAYLAALARHELTFGVGPAGTGKTYLAVANAVLLYMERRVERIVLSRPAVEAGEQIGFLPGDMKEKVDPYMRPLYDSLYDMLSADYVDKRLQSGEIEIAPLAFMRGRTLARAAVILDEAQNATPAQMKMFLTRLGEGSHMAVTGDPTQSDLRSGDATGLSDALATLAGVEGVAAVTFNAGDVVRHPLVARIINAYDARSRASGPAGASPRG